MYTGNCLCGNENVKIFPKNIGGSLWYVCQNCLNSA